MRKRRKYRGFSLTEVLLAVGTLAVGMVFISGTFLTGIHFSTIATERSIAAVVADEAFAKVRIYGSADPNWLTRLSVNSCSDFKDANDVVNTQIVLLVRDPGEFAYPSVNTFIEKQYYWSALCRPIYPDPANRLTQVTVFVSRKMGSSTMYWKRDPENWPNLIEFPAPCLVRIYVNQDLSIHNRNELLIKDAIPTDLIDETMFVNDGFNILDSQRGQIYRVIERYADNPSTILLDRPWQGGSDALIWVIPPPVGGGKNPCIAVYQKLIRF